MKLYISKGIGTGPTALSAFDTALVKAGVANFNLIYLSSVIPPGSEVITNRPIDLSKAEWGDKLYVVIAQKRTTRRNQEVWAGIGWVQEKETGKGLFVEHEGHSKNEVKEDIKASLSQLMETRKANFGKINMEIVGTKCENEPTCALVVAVFQSVGWKRKKFNRLKIT